MKKKILFKVLIISLILTIIPSNALDVYALTKAPKKVTVRVFSIDKTEVGISTKNKVTISWNKVSCTGYQIYRSRNGEPFSKVCEMEKNSLTTFKDTSPIGAWTPADADNGYSLKYKVRAYNKYKQKQYYNSKTKKWVTKKPASSQWKGKKTKKVTKKKTGSFSEVQTTIVKLKVEKKDSPKKDNGASNTGGSGSENPPQYTNASSTQLTNIKAAADAFTTKWYTQVQNRCKAIVNDSEKYTNSDELLQRWIYDGLCDLLKANYTNATGASPRDTEYKFKCSMDTEYGLSHSGLDDYNFRINLDSLKNAVLKNPTTYYTFNEFKSKCNSMEFSVSQEIFSWVKNSNENSKFLPTATLQSKLIADNSFNSLSDAMKIYALDQSKYFGCYFAGDVAPTDFHMVYDFAKQGCTRMMSITSDELEGILVYVNKNSYTILSEDVGYFIQFLNKLTNNTATGVCDDYATYEYLYFKALGINVWKNSSSLINHAWTVVKVNNSDGKALWIPFDYGVGPAKNLLVNDSQKQYINTEAKRYALYLSGISGAPNSKNFTDNDFK